jgi:hypothetical protein
MSIQEFDFAMTDLWDQLALTKLAKLKACGVYIDRREQQRLMQFLTALHSDFEGLGGSILHCSPLPSVDQFAMTDLWDQLALIESTELKAYGAYIDRREQQQLIQFLTALHSDFEGLRGSIMHRSPLLSVDSIISEILVEEIHLQSYFEKGILSTLNPFVLAVPSKSFSNNQNKPYTRVAFDECSFCK